MSLPFVGSLIPPWARWLGAAVLLLAAFVSGWRASDQRWRLKQAAATQAALQQEREQRRMDERRRTVLQGIDDAKDAELRRTGALLADALERLRHRPERLPEPARAACGGATGAELSGPDAAFLVREAARADDLRAELAACQQRERAGAVALSPVQSQEGVTP